MSGDNSLVFLDLALAGLEETLGLDPEQIVRAGDEPGPELRARVKVLVTGGPTPLPTERVESFPNLTTIVGIAAGHDGIDLQHARSRGIAVAGAIGVNAADVADLAVGSLIALVREIVTGDQLVRSGGWYPRRVAPSRSVGSLKVGMVGLGTIGEQIVRRMSAFGCPIAWYGPRDKDVPWTRIGSVQQLARESDVLFVAAPLSAATRGMIGPAIIEALGPDGYIVNVGRGPLLDEDAVIAALREGRLGGAALDVFVDEPTPPERWRDVPNTVLTPHVGGVTHEAMRGVMTRCAQNVRAALADAPLQGRVA